MTITRWCRNIEPPAKGMVSEQAELDVGCYNEFYLPALKCGGRKEMFILIDDEGRGNGTTTIHLRW